MAFRINNALSEEDYKTIVETLSDKKTFDEGSRYHHFDTEGITVRILRHNELEVPLATIAERFSDGEIRSQDAESYDICIPIEYESRENNFAAVVSLLKDRNFEGYKVSAGKKTIDFFRGDLGYRASAVGREVTIRTIRERKIEVESIKADIAAILFVTELVVNGVYEADKGEIELELKADIKRSRLMLNKNRKNRMEKAIVLEKPTLTFQDIGGCEEAKSELTLLGHGLQKPESFEKWGIRYPRGILLHGPPGTGKTLLAKAMANLANAALYCVSVTDVLTCWYGESPKLIGKVFDIAQKNAPAIILFDEIDSLAQRRADSDEESVKIISVFLQKMDGIKGMDKVTVIGTTNFMEKIDPAMLRPGRFDKIIEVPTPDKIARSQIFKLHAKGKRVNEAIDYDALASKTDAFTGAEIAETLQMGLGKKLKEELNTGNADLAPLSTEEILESISEYKKRKDSRSFGSPTENRAMYA